MPVQEVIPDQEPVVAQAPTNRVSHFEYARSGSYLARGMEELSQGLDALATPFAEQQAASDLAKTTVSRNADGSLTVNKPSTMPIFGPAGEHYDKTIAAGTLAMGDNQAATDIANLRAQHEGDPEGFKQAVTAYTQRMQASNPGILGASMAQNAARIGTQHYVGMVNEKARVDTENAKAAINDAMTAKFNTLAALAEQGGTDTPEFKQARAEYGAMSDNLVANPAFGISKEVQDANLKSTDSLLMGYAITGHVDRDMKAGGIVQARQNLHDAVNDPSLDLSPAERAKLYAQGEARIMFNTGQNAADVAANKENFKALDQAAKSPETAAKLSEPIWQAAIVKSQSLGDVETTKQLEALHQVWQVHRGTMGLAPNQSLNAQGIGAAPQSPQEAADQSVAPGTSRFLNKLETLESGGRNIPNVTEGTSSGQAQGFFQITTGTWKEFAQKAGVDLTKYPTPLSAPHDVQYSVGSIIPMGRWAPETLTGLRAAGFTVDPSKTLAQNVAMNGGGAPSANGTPFTDEQVKANPFLMSTWVRSIASDPENRYSYGAKLGAAILQNVKNGFVPNVDDLANYGQLAANEPRLAEQAGHIRAAVDGMAAADGAINLPPGQGKAYIDAVVQRAQGGSIYQQELAAQARDFYQKDVEQLKKDPWGFAAAKGWAKGEPAPLNFDDPNQLAIGLHQRSDIASSIAQRTGDNTIGALAPDEREQVKSILATGTPAQIANLRSAVSTLPDARQRATLAAIGQTGADGRVFAVSGALQSEAPQVADAIWAGQQLLKDKGEFAPKPAAVNAELAKYLPQAIFQPQARQTVGAAVTALYAKMSADANDATANELKTDRFKDAVNQVTGGIVSMRGNSLVAPWYGASQANFNDALQSLTDDDLKGSVTKEGRPLSAALLKPGFMDHFTSNGFKLENNGVGDGKYRVYSGSGDAKAYIKGPNGQPFLLDLGAKRAAILAKQAASATPAPWFTSDQGAAVAQP